MTYIKKLNTYDEVAQAHNTFLELRPHLQDKDSFVFQVLEQKKEGYEMTALYEQEQIVACIGFRILTTLAWGKILYIDDLITREENRGKGYGKYLLNYSVKIAKEHMCQEVHLDTGYFRHGAHKVYIKQGFEFNCHHMALKI